MAYQQLCLEPLFHYIAKHNKLSLGKISAYFNASMEDVIGKLNELHAMGLPVIIDANSVKLNQSISPLDIKSIQSQCPTKIYYCFSVDSTNTQAKASREDAIFITEHQTQGRGQHGKSWLTPLGQSVALSLAYTFEFSLTHLSGLNIAIGVAVMHAIKRFSQQRISLKWPNDIIGEFGKIAGILIEAQGSKNRCKAYIGIGINWNVAQSLLDSINQPSMNAEIASINRGQFIVCLLKELETVIQDFKSNKLTNLISQWNEFDFLKNHQVEVIEPTNSYKATYLNVDNDGLLRVCVGNQERNISSASIKVGIIY